MITIDVASAREGVFELAGEESGAILDLESGSSPRPVSKIRYRLEARILGTEMLVTGWIEVDIEYTCVRCLERFVDPLRLDPYEISLEAADSEGVDLTERVREDILLALPPYPHCEATGSRECPAVNRFEEGHSSSAPPAGPAPGGVWDVLDSLREGNDE